MFLDSSPEYLGVPQVEYLGPTPRKGSEAQKAVVSRRVPGIKMVFRRVLGILRTAVSTLGREHRRIGRDHLVQLAERSY